MSAATEIAQWLKTKPGLYCADTLDAVWGKVYAAACVANPAFKKLDPQTFKEDMVRCGYEAVHRGGHSGVAEHYVIALPEQQAGSRQ